MPIVKRLFSAGRAIGSVALLCGVCACGQGQITSVSGDSLPPKGDNPPSGDPDQNGQSPSLFSAAQPIVTSLGGAVLEHPKLVAVTFDGDADASQLEQFIQRIGASTYWTATTSEYGVGAPTAMAIHASAAPASLDDSQKSTLQPWLAAKFQGANPPFGKADAEAVYVLFFPSQTKISVECGTDMCESGIGAYHVTDFRLSDGARVAYAVVPRCAGTGGGMYSDLDLVTAFASHEIVETVTDPWGDAFDAVDDAHSAWGMFGAEVGDMCENSPNPFIRPPDIGFLVQRTWSNASAKAGHDPCVPQTTTYFNAVPQLDDSLAVPAQDGSNKTVPAPGILLQVGKPKTIEIELSSDGATTGPWDVDAVDFSPDVTEFQSEEQCQASGGSPPAPLLSFSFDRKSGQAGDRLHLTVTANRAGTQPYPLQIQSTLGDATNVWFAWFQASN